MSSPLCCESLKNYFLDPYTIGFAAVQTALLPIETRSEKVAFAALQLIAKFSFYSQPFFTSTTIPKFLDRELQRVVGKGYWGQKTAALFSTAATLGAATLGALYLYNACSSWALKGLITGLYSPIAAGTTTYFKWKILDSHVLQNQDIRQVADRISWISSWAIQFGCLATGFTPISALAIGVVASKVLQAAYKQLATPAEIRLPSHG